MAEPVQRLGDLVLGAELPLAHEAQDQGLALAAVHSTSAEDLERAVDELRRDGRAAA